MIALTVIAMGLCTYVYWQCAIAYYNQMKRGGGGKFSKLDDISTDDAFGIAQEVYRSDDDASEIDDDDVGGTYADDGFAYGNDDDDDDDDDDGFDDGSSGMELRPLPRGAARNL